MDELSGKFERALPKDSGFGSEFNKISGDWRETKKGTIQYSHITLHPENSNKTFPEKTHGIDVRVSGHGRAISLKSARWTRTYSTRIAFKREQVDIYRAFFANMAREFWL